jgi:hypothetical protein
MTEMPRKPDPPICTPWYATSLQGADGFATQPRDAERWIRSFRPSSAASVAVDVCSARPIVDITPALRGVIKTAAFERSITVPDMLRDLLAREFSDTDESARSADPTPGARHVFYVGPWHTEVELTWVEGRIEHWIHFGHDSSETILDRCRRILHLTPRNVFAFVRWATDDFRTVVSRIDDVRAVDRGDPYQTPPFAGPGGEILLRISGWPEDRTCAPGDRRGGRRLASTPLMPPNYCASQQPPRRRRADAAPTAANNIASAGCAGGPRHNAFRLHHDHLCRDALRRAYERLPSRAKAALERRRERAVRAPRGAAHASAPCR